MSIGNIKSNLSSMILIPYWIAEAVIQHGMALSDVLDYEKIRPVLSMHDMATFMAAQWELNTLLYAGQHSSEECTGPGEIEEAWRRFTEAWTIDRQAYSGLTKTPSTDYLKTATYSGDASVRVDVMGRLYGSAVKLERYPDPFSVVNLAPKVVGIIVYPGYFDNKQVDLYLQHQLIKALLDVFYVQGAPYHELASTPLFKRHLQLLSSE